MPKTRTSFQKGHKGGRPPGTPNRLTSTVRETVLNVFQKIQEDPKHNLEAFSKKHPRDFYQIAAKLIPTEITGTLKQKFVVNVKNGDGN